MNGYHILFGAIMLALFNDMMLRSIGYQSEELEGAFVKKEEPTLTLKTWFDGSFGQQYEQFREEDLALRNSLVRLYNQKEYTLYEKTKSGMVVGKDGVVIQKGYIASIRGDDFTGRSKIAEHAAQTRLVQDSLAAKGTMLVYLMAASKAECYPECIPDDLGPVEKDSNNVVVFYDELRRAGVNVIDANGFFRQLRSETDTPLFPKNGTHWSGYGLTLMADSLFRYVEVRRGMDLRDFHSEEGEWRTDSLSFTDNDLGELMNLLYGPEIEPLYYPKVVFEPLKAGQRRLRLLSIGDSFNQSFFGFDEFDYFTALTDSSSRYWYYNKRVTWPERFEGQYIMTNTLDALDEVQNRDVVLIVCTSTNLPQMTFGFVPKLFALFTDPEAKAKFDYESFVESQSKAIAADPAWKESIRQKAKKNGVDYDSQLQDDIEWLWQQKTKKTLDAD